MKTTKVVVGALAGAATGAILGILFAPNKGSDTRKKILRKGRDVAENIKDRVEHIVDAVS
ncbi:MAG: YtxH domain-containing protein [Bacteroidota bacterium]|nr:YtxH domain-containing protein [Bacteroidota bacterium]